MPTLEELSIAMDGLARGKALGKDGIPLEVLKHGKQTILQPLHELLCLCFDGATSNAFTVSSGLKQGCDLSPTLFGIFFSLLLQYAFIDCTEGVYVRTRSDGKLFNIARLCDKAKAYMVLIQKLLFADDAALRSHSEKGLHHLVDKLPHPCKEFGLMISLRKTNIMAQGAESPPVITINNTELEVVDTFTYLGSTVSSLTSLDAEISCRIAKPAAVMAKLNKRVWGNDLLCERSKMWVYQACVLSTLLYGSESWMTYARQDRRLNTFHLRCLRRLLYIRWQDRVTDTEVLERAGSLSMPSLLIQRCLRWLSHAHRMEPDRLPREILYGELWEGVRRDTSAWEDIANRRDTWRQNVKVGVSKAEVNARVQATCKRAVRKERAASARVSTMHVCATCNRDCDSRIGLHSHTRSCPNPQC